MSLRDELWLRIVRNEELLELYYELDNQQIGEDDPHGYWAKAQELMLDTRELFQKLQKEDL